MKGLAPILHLNRERRLRGPLLIDASKLGSSEKLCTAVEAVELEVAFAFLVGNWWNTQSLIRQCNSRKNDITASPSRKRSADNMESHEQDAE